MASLSKKVIYFLPFVSFFTVFCIMNWTDPANNVTSILLVFLLLYICCASALFILFYDGIAIIKKAFHTGRNAQVDMHISLRRAYYLSSIIAFAPICLLAMQSINTIKLLDLILVGVLTGLAVFYVIKRTA